MYFYSRPYINLTGKQTVGGCQMSQIKHRKSRSRPTLLHGRALAFEQKAAEKTVRALDLSADLIAGMVHLELSGNREAVVEGCRGVLEYDENVIRIDGGKISVRFMGTGLELRNFTDHSATISGVITSIEFLT